MIESWRDIFSLKTCVPERNLISSHKKLTSVSFRPLLMHQTCLSHQWTILSPLEFGRIESHNCLRNLYLLRMRHIPFDKEFNFASNTHLWNHRTYFNDLCEMSRDWHRCHPIETSIAHLIHISIFTGYAWVMCQETLVP
jgi:hypothetical protein